jgi:hypothetical protein
MRRTTESRNGSANRPPELGNGKPAPNAIPTPPAGSLAAQFGPPVETEIPPLSEADQRALADFQCRQDVLRDLTTGCVHGRHVGAYIFGPPGVSKSFTIVERLRELEANCRVYQRITAKPLYLEMERFPSAVFVLDDCEQLLGERSAQTLLRSALGGERVGNLRERKVTFSVTGRNARVLTTYFWGAIVFTANRAPATERAEIAGVMSRIPSINFAPPDHEIRALMRHVARRGFVDKAGSMSPRECVEVVEYVIQTAAELEGRLDLRWLEHAYAHYLTAEVSGGRTDWRDMVRFHLLNALTRFEHRPVVATSGPRDGASEVAVALEIAALPGLTKEQRVQLWASRTGRSAATYYRRRDAGRQAGDR